MQAAEQSALLLEPRGRAGPMRLEIGGRRRRRAAARLMANPRGRTAGRFLGFWHKKHYVLQTNKQTNTSGRLTDMGADGMPAHETLNAHASGAAHQGWVHIRLPEYHSSSSEEEHRLQHEKD